MTMGIFETSDEKKKDSLADDVILMQNLFRSKMGVFAYPAFGTLLGIVREGDFIREDTDIDMAWHSESKTRAEVMNEVLRKFHHARKRRVFAWPHNFTGTMKVQVTTEMRAGFAEGLTYMDMCVSWNEGGNYWVNIFGDYGRPIDMTPTEATLRGKTVLIPKGAVDFLEATYGDWRTPKNRTTHPDGGFRSPTLSWGNHLTNV